MSPPAGPLPQWLRRAARLGSARAGSVVLFALGVLFSWPGLTRDAVVGRPAALAAGEPAAAAGTFSTARALGDIERWSAIPRPMGSAPQAAVLRDLVATLAATGLQARIVPLGRLNNVEAHAPGADHAGGVWLVAHSDTVPRAPGAADDGLGLGVVVEAARVLAVAGPPSGLHVLITDGEERGLLGAEAYAAATPGDARVVINIESRGTEGPPYMFQTAGPTRALVAELAESGCRAQATSLARAVYRQLPNDTDFTVFRRKGWSGYDFAIIGGAWRYHTPDDTLANLDPRSVQAMGDCVVGLARAWLDRGVEPDETPVVYAQVAGRTVYGPEWVVRGLAAILAAGVIFARKKAGRAGVAAFALAPGLAALVGVALAFVPLLLPTASWQRPAEIADPYPFFAAAWAVGAAAALVALHAARRASGAEAADGWSLAHAAFAAAVAFTWPVGGYVLLPIGAVALANALGLGGAAALFAGFAGLVSGPVLVALPIALTTRMMPVLCVVPVVLCGALLAGPSWRRAR